MKTCPACEAPLHVLQRFVLESTDGPIECVKAQCDLGHWWTCAISDLEAARLRKKS